MFIYVLLCVLNKDQSINQSNTKFGQLIIYVGLPGKSLKFIATRCHI